MRAQSYRRVCLVRDPRAHEIALRNSEVYGSEAAESPSRQAQMTSKQLLTRRVQASSRNIASRRNYLSSFARAFGFGNPHLRELHR